MKKIAYLVLAHTDTMHFSKLIDALGDKCDIYVHIDKKSDISSFKAVTNCNNVNFIDDRISISWAGISMIDAQNLLLKKALEKKELYTHLIFLSGSCYPIKKAEKIHVTMLQNPKREFIRFIDMRESPKHYMKHINRKWFKEPLFKKCTPVALADKVIRKIFSLIGISNHWNSKMIPFFGSQWCALTVNCCEFLITYQRNNPWYREMNRHTFAPDEHYYHTIIGNSHFRNMADGKQDLIEGWASDMASLHLIDESLSKWFTLDDWEEIRNSDKLFVRKIRSYDGSNLVEYINKKILG